jgi:hypothetical protein
MGLCGASRSASGADAAGSSGEAFTCTLRAEPLRQQPEQSDGRDEAWDAAGRLITVTDGIPLR